MNTRPLYFDYMATTPVDPRVIAKMVQYMGPGGVYGNASSQSHVYGQAAATAVEVAREQIAQSIGAEPQSLVFTSGATEANNLAILGAARFYCSKGKHVITACTEHKSVLDSFKQLEKEGFTVTYLKPNRDGLILLSDIERAVCPETTLVSLMHVNNEIGVIQDIAAIGQFLQRQGIIFHVDAAQSAGKLAINLKALAVHLMSFSAHKNYGPKGIGALYISQKPRLRLYPLSFGGAQERGLRAGTLAVHQIVGMGEAFAIGEAERTVEQANILRLRVLLWEGIRALPNIYLNGHKDYRVAGNLNISFGRIAGESLLLALRDLAVSSTSACMASSLQPSYVLKALGLSNELASSSIRLAIGRFTTEEEVKTAVSIICREIKKLHEISPL